jgi:hypothetical protein
MVGQGRSKAVQIAVHRRRARAMPLSIAMLVSSREGAREGRSRRSSGHKGRPQLLHWDDHHRCLCQPLFGLPPQAHAGS